jgi:hypothetical protein
MVVIRSWMLVSSRLVRVSRRSTGMPSARLAVIFSIRCSPPEQGRPEPRAAIAAGQSITATGCSFSRQHRPCAWARSGGEADLEAVGFAEPAFPQGLADAGGQIAADVREPLPLARLDAEERAANTAVLMDAGRRVGPAALAEGNLPALEVAEELFPFLVGWGPVLLARAYRPAAGDEARWPLMTSSG